MGEVSREVHGVLARAAADFEHIPAVCESTSEDLENGALVTLASFGDGVGHERESVTISRSRNLNAALRISVL
jgi:hypothetical protein